jgi:hypothetical protein
MLLQLVARFERRVLFFPLPDTEVRVGSSPDNDIVIPFPGVSRTHAIVRPHGGQLEIVDAGSTNGQLVSFPGLPLPSSDRWRRIVQLYFSMMIPASQVFPSRVWSYL